MLMTCACYNQIVDFPGPLIGKKGELDETYLPISTNPYRALSEEPIIPAMLDERLPDPRNDGTAQKTTHGTVMILRPVNSCNRFQKG